MNSDFFTNNRKKLTELLPGSLVIMTAYSAMQRMGDMSIPFEQEANFWYLTGIEEADWLLVMDAMQNTSWLVAPDISEVHRVFNGALDSEAASKQSGIKKVISQTEFDSLLRTLATRHSVAYTTSQPVHSEHFGFVLNPAHAKLSQKLERIFADVQTCTLELTKLRAIKQPQEVKAISAAINITKKAFEHARTHMDSYKHEYEIEADIAHIFRKSGATGHAYDPIVAAGEHACTLHYGKNSSVLKKRQLVLIDVGARMHGYAADITRTYAVGQPTKRQVEVHAKVQKAQADIIALLKPGLTVEKYQEHVTAIMMMALDELGLLGADKEAALRRYFPHAIGHGLGIDVHDELGRPASLLEGMVLTVEPGIYIPEEGIGVRIEDDILITSSGHRNLSGGLSTDVL
ncbi:aminopeptidase P N-terminal domain-containing protein [Candidatus Saccharibacteria bacterium]|nr:aminopeptidase P N-terminal domain-containing protein [Candidatus Saccharibacteria bacterium]